MVEGLVIEEQQIQVLIVIKLKKMRIIFFPNPTRGFVRLNHEIISKYVFTILKGNR